MAAIPARVAGVENIVLATPAPDDRLLAAAHLAGVTSIGTLVAFLVVSVGVIVLRRTAPDLPRGFRVPGYPVTPILSIAGCLWIVVGLKPMTITVFAIWVGVVLVWYFAYGIRHSRLRATAADPREDVL